MSNPSQRKHNVNVSTRTNVSGSTEISNKREILEEKIANREKDSILYSIFFAFFTIYYSGTEYREMSIGLLPEK